MSQFANYAYGDQTLQFENFDLSFLRQHPKIAIIGKAIGSESDLMHKIVSYLTNTLPAGLIISPKNKLTKFYDDIVNPIFIHEEYQEKIISKLLYRQKLMIEKNKNESQIDPRAYLVMDDCVDDMSIIQDPLIRKIFLEGKFYFLSFVLSMQYPIGIPPSLRMQFDYIFLLDEETYTNKKRVYEYYAGMFESFDLFDQVFLQITTNNRCMVINNRIRSADINKKIFWLDF